MDLIIFVQKCKKNLFFNGFQIIFTIKNYKH